ncbi:MAG: peptidylprolyl isomerase [Paludibacteraceae bacterium]|nr:peptidylprolyl isomerase [Paludibacteraceae bacterium]
MNRVITCTYDLFVDGENGQSKELMERATIEHPLTYCEDMGMMLPKFEDAMKDKNENDTFDFRIGYEDAYGEYDTDGVLTLDKKLFYNGDGEFDEERVFVGNIVPMNTTDGRVVRAQIVEITEDKVTIDLNHPLAGENLHFVGKIIEIREATEAELEALRHPHKCGHCHGNCHNEEGGCEGKCEEGGCGGGCDECHNN